MEPAERAPFGPPEDRPESSRFFRLGPREDRPRSSGSPIREYGAAPYHLCKEFARHSRSEIFNYFDISLA